MVVRTGAYAYAQWDFECMFDENECVGCRNKVFGLEQRITSHNWTNSPIILNQLNSVEPKTFAYGQARGTLGIDFVVSNPWFNSLLFARNSMCCLFPSGCPSPFTYTWDATSVCTIRCVESFSVEIAVDQCMVNTVRTATGSIVNSMSIRSSIGEPIRATLDVSYTSDDRGVALDACPATEVVGVAVCQFEPYTFAHGDLLFDYGCCMLASVAEIQSFDLTLNPNAELLFQHNCNHASSAFRKVFEMSGSFQAPYICYCAVDELYGQIADNSITSKRESAALSIVFDNGCSAGAEREIRYTFTGILLKDHTTTAEPVEPIYETLNWQARSVVVSAINGTANEP